jgi:hypothetical protein
MKDTQGREWLFRFTARTVRELAAETRLDTKALDGENSLLQRVGQDESLLYLVLWVTIRPQAIDRNVTEDEWFESLDNDALQAATREWIEAYINFSHPARQKVLSRVTAATDRRLTKAIAEVESAIASGRVDQVIEEALGKTIAPRTSTGSTNTAAASLASSG